MRDDLLHAEADHEALRPGRGPGRDGAEADALRHAAEPASSPASSSPSASCCTGSPTTCGPWASSSSSSARCRRPDREPHKAKAAADKPAVDPRTLAPEARRQAGPPEAGPPGRDRRRPTATCRADSATSATAPPPARERPPDGGSTGRGSGAAPARRQTPAEPRQAQAPLTGTGRTAPARPAHRPPGKPGRPPRPGRNSVSAPQHPSDTAGSGDRRHRVSDAARDRRPATGAARRRRRQRRRRRRADDDADDDEDGRGRRRGRRRHGDDLLVREGDVAGDYLERLLDILDVDGDIDLDVEGDRASVAIVGGRLERPDRARTAPRSRRCRS